MTPAKLMIVDPRHGLRHIDRARLVDVLLAGDLVIANDAATLPASLHGIHARTGEPIEVRLAGRGSLSCDVADFSAVVFGAGDFHTRTEDRPLPPILTPGDTLALGPLSATVTAVLGHARLISLHFDGSSDEIWSGIASHGKPVQYAHAPMPLALWDVWTRIASLPVAFEPPSASFALDWQMIAAMRARNIGFATITHAAGISSTGDVELDSRLPFDEPYDIPASTARAITTTRARGGRIVAIGTTVVRALEHAGPRRHEPRRHEGTKNGPRRHDDTKDGPRRHDGTKPENWIVRAGPGIATQRIGPGTRLRVVDAILTGVHERGTSHYELLRAFADDRTLAAADDEMAAHGYRPHEFGDSILVIPPARFDPVGLPTEL